MSVNRVILLGRVGQEPKVTEAQNGTVMGSFSLATSYKNRKGGEVHEETEWHNCQVFGKLAEVVRNYVHKGDTLYVEGRIRTRKWEQNGETKYRTEIIVEKVTMEGSAKREAPSFPSSYEKSKAHRPAPISNGIASDDSDVPF